MRNFELRTPLFSAFDPETFLSGGVEGAMSTELINVPVGEWAATSTKVEAKEISREDGTKGVVVDLFWEISDPQVQQITKREKNQVKQSFFLDMTEDGHVDLSEGKNVQIGRHREAFGMNRPGQRWSFKDLVGRGGFVLVEQKPDKKDPSRIFAQVKSARPF